MSKREDQIFLLERGKMYIAEGHLFGQTQSAIDIVNEIIEQISKTETLVIKRAFPLWSSNKQYAVKKEFAYQIANHIVENGLAEPKPVGITNEQTEQYELEISFIKR